MITIRADGKTVTTEGGVPTYAIAAPILAGNETVEDAAPWWDVSEAAVLAAVRWEREMKLRPAFAKALHQQGEDYWLAYLKKRHPRTWRRVINAAAKAAT